MLTKSEYPKNYVIKAALYHMTLMSMLNSQADNIKMSNYQSDEEILHFSDCFAVLTHMVLFPAFGFFFLQNQVFKQDYHGSFGECLTPICFLQLFHIWILC